MDYLNISAYIHSSHSKDFEQGDGALPYASANKKNIQGPIYKASEIQYGDEELVRQYDETSSMFTACSF